MKRRKISNFVPQAEVNLYLNSGDWRHKKKISVGVFTPHFYPAHGFSVLASVENVFEVKFMNTYKFMSNKCLLLSTEQWTTRIQKTVITWKGKTQTFILILHTNREQNPKTPKPSKGEKKIILNSRNKHQDIWEEDWNKCMRAFIFPSG